MDVIRTKIVDAFRAKFPTMRGSINPFIGLLDEQTDGQISYSAPGILVCAINCQEVPEEIAPWELRANWGLVVTVKGASAAERDAAGWLLATKAAQLVYRNTWGMGGEVCPSIITSIAKNEARTPAGLPTGVNYWTVQFYNWIKFSAVLPE